MDAVETVPVVPEELAPDCALACGRLETGLEETELADVGLDSALGEFWDTAEVDAVETIPAVPDELTPDCALACDGLVTGLADEGIANVGLTDVGLDIVPDDVCVKPPEVEADEANPTVPEELNPDCALACGGLDTGLAETGLADVGLDGALGKVCVDPPEADGNEVTTAVPELPRFDGRLAPVELEDWAGKVCDNPPEAEADDVTPAVLELPTFDSRLAPV